MSRNMELYRKKASVQRTDEQTTLLILAIVGIIMIFTIGFVVASSSYIHGIKGSSLTSNIFSLPNPPLARLSAVDCYDALEGLNYVTYISFTVRNNGGNGYITVEGSYRQYANTKTLYLREGESERITFKFDTSFWGGETRGTCLASIKKETAG